MNQKSFYDFYKGKKVLITGNTGFKGAWMSRILINLGAKVTGIALEPDTTPALYEILNLREDLEENIIDVRDYDKMKSIFDKTKPDVVFHLAAQPIVIESYHNPRYTYDVNVMGTVNVCECVRLTDSVKSFVNVTTDKVYRNLESDIPYQEKDVLDGHDPYSNSKSCSELVTASYKRSFFEENAIPASTCRAGNVIGGGDFAAYRIIPDCVRATVENKEIEIRNPNSIRPYQHVLEAVMFYLLVAMNQVTDYKFSGAYNIGPNYSDCITSKNVVELFCKYWGDNAAWKTCDYEGPHEAGLLKLDISKAKSALKWSPIWTAAEAIEETVKWYKAFYLGNNMQEVTDEQINRYLSLAEEKWGNR